MVEKDAETLTVLVNRKSGGQRGNSILAEFQAVLGTERVFAMDEGPAKGLERAWQLVQGSGGALPIARVIVAGGDGTVDWVLGYMEENLSEEQRNAVALAHLPLGTGNDMARSTGWGGGYDGGAPERIIKEVLAAEPKPLDRWKLTMKTSNGQEEKKVFANYSSVGADAAVAYNFHHLRETKPHLFKGRAINKVWYGTSGIKALFKGQIPRLNRSFSVSVDGKDIQIPRKVRTIVLLNIPSYMGGSDVWGARKEQLSGLCIKPEQYELQSSGDGKIELVGFGGPANQAMIAAFKRHGVRLAQGTKAVIKCEKDRSYAQVDGEPWIQEVGYEATIESCARAMMLVKK